MAHFKAEVHDWYSAKDFLNGNVVRKIAHNTQVEYVGESPMTFTSVYGVRYHGTLVVRYYYGGVYQLNSGGYRTLTTKERINKCLPPEWGLWQDKFVWYIGVRESSREEGRVWEFEDGMIIAKPGGKWEVTGAREVTPKQEEANETKD